MPLVNIESAFLKLIHFDPRVYFIYNLSTRLFEYANPAFYEYFQVNQAGLKPKYFLNMISEERSRFERTFCSLKPGLLHKTYGISIKLPNGLQRTVELSLVLEQHQDESIISGFLEDITGQKDLDSKKMEVAAARDLKRRALRHDLSGTLGFIPTFTSLLLKKTEGLDDKQIPVLLSSIESISKETLARIKDYMNDEPN
jgi:hypothetical protein